MFETPIDRHSNTELNVNGQSTPGENVASSSMAGVSAKDSAQDAAFDASHDAADRVRMVSDTRELSMRRNPSKNQARKRVRISASHLPDFDPIARLRALTSRENRIGMSIGLAGALLVHGAAAAHGLSSLLSLEAFSSAIRSAVQDDMRAVYAVEVAKPPPPAEPTPEPEPEKPQVAQKVPSQPAQPKEPPPAPAQAGKVLTAEPDPSEPLDLTDQGFVTGEGDKFVGGVTAANGTSKVAVRDTNAKIGGVPGAKGTGAPAPPAGPAKIDLTRPATPATFDWADCGFPPEADVEQIDFMKVSVVVTVGVDGRAINATVLNDKGYGFGRLARQCAMRKTYNVGLDANGKPTTTTTPPIVVRFTR